VCHKYVERGAIYHRAVSKCEPSECQTVNTTGFCNTMNYCNTKTMLNIQPVACVLPLIQIRGTKIGGISYLYRVAGM
jgi:hypothetical protein